MVTGGFMPSVELFAPVAEFAIASAEVEVVDGQTHATLTRTLPANGEYNLIVSGASETDAGDYSLTFTVAGRTPPTVATPRATVQPRAIPPAATATAVSGPRGRRGIPTPQGDTTPVATPTRRATPTRSATVAPTPTLMPTATPLPTATFTPAPPTAIPSATPFLPSGDLETFCTVTTDRLNLRPGPVTNFTPPITVLETGAFMVVMGRNAESAWLQVAVLDENLVVEFTGWVSADFVFCVGNLESAPVVEVEA